MQVIARRVPRRELEVLRRQWVDEAPFGIVITGPAGSGKTVLARMLASEVLEETRDLSVVQFFGVRSELPSFDQIEASFSRTASARSPHRPFLLRRSPPPRPRRLLVLDGLDELPQPEVERVPELLAELEEQRVASMVIVTTRGVAPTVSRNWTHLELNAMPLHEIRELLVGLEVAFKPEDMTRLASAADGSPLVAALLGRLANKPGETLDSIIARLEAQNLLTLLPESEERFFGELTSELSTLPFGPEVEIRVRAVDDSLVRYLTAHPEKLYDLRPRQLEELMAELYRREGFEVELTQETRDGGVDLYLVRHAPFGKLLTIVDAKRMRADRPVGVGVVRQLYGVVEAQRASAGVVATTSFFTRDARKFQEALPFRLGLQDYFDLQTMLRRASGVHLPPSPQPPSAQPD